jgi:hypothetical protein
MSGFQPFEGTYYLYNNRNHLASIASSYPRRFESPGVKFLLIP